MSAVGETLRREREKRNLELEQISRELKISSRFLEAIEEEQFDKLPGVVFAKSFVRQYARLLGLDEDELAAEVQRAIDPPSAVPHFAQQSRPAAADIRVPRVEAWQTVGGSRFSSSLPALALVVVVMLICSGVYAWWQRQRSLVSAHVEVQAPIQAPVQTAQARQPEPLGVPPAPPPESAPAQAAQPQTPAAAPASLDRPPVENASSSAPRPAADPTKPSTPPPNPAAPNPNAAVRVEVTAGETVWVLAQGDGKYLFSGTLEANQTRTVEANEKVLLRLGNAGGVTITLNGKPIGAVGPKGQVRTVQFTSGGFQIVAAPKPSLPLDDIL
ncbi:Transcriptional regulator, XRE family [Candidatus Sulfopaludibacter sp. SbA6]|nr:Transcriptional regulator, XRE family [Candidatus Sulfopaludibacter sp. SbA6]